MTELYLLRQALLVPVPISPSVPERYEQPGCRKHRDRDDRSHGPTQTRPQRHPQLGETHQNHRDRVASLAVTAPRTMMPVPVMNIARPLGPSPKRVASTLE